MKDYILQLFRANTGTLRTALTFSSLVGEEVHSTNGHAIIAIPASSLMLKYEAIEDYPNTNSFIQPDMSEALMFELSDIVHAIAKLRGAFEMQQCDKCSGTGEIICKCCDNEAECKACDGSGDGDGERYLSQWYYDYNLTRLKMGNHYFNPTLINKLLIAAGMLGCEAVQMHKNREGQNGLIFLFSDVKVCIMPVYAGSHPDQDRVIEIPHQVIKQEAES